MDGEKFAKQMKAEENVVRRCRNTLRKIDDASYGDRLKKNLRKAKRQAANNSAFTALQLRRKVCSPQTPAMKQRDKMRELFRRFNGDRLRVIEAYVKAESLGEVGRVSDSRGMSANDYALRLFADGIRKEWIQQ